MPSADDAINRLVQSGAKHISLIPRTFTHGGSHSELEIAEFSHKVGQYHHGIRLTYPWPVDLEYLADFIVGHLKNNVHAEVKTD